MAWMRCRSCTTLFAIGLLRCPQCQAMSELYARPDYEDEQEEQMPKATVAGASNALEEREPGYVAPDEAEAPTGPDEVEAEAESEAEPESEPAEEAASDVTPKPAAKTSRTRKAAAKE